MEVGVLSQSISREKLGSEPRQRRIQRCFGRTIQFCGVTKLGCRNGAATWAECSGSTVRSRGFWGKPVFRLTAYENKNQNSIRRFHIARRRRQRVHPRP